MYTSFPKGFFSFYLILILAETSPVMVIMINLYGTLGYTNCI